MVKQGKPVKRAALHHKAAHEVAALLGHDLSKGGGVSIEDDVVVVHLPGAKAPRQIEHRIEG